MENVYTSIPADETVTNLENNLKYNSRLCNSAVKYIVIMSKTILNRIILSIISIFTTRIKA